MLSEIGFQDLRAFLVERHGDSMDVADVIARLYQKGTIRPWDASSDTRPTSWMRWHAFLYHLAVTLHLAETDAESVLVVLNEIRPLVRHKTSVDPMPGWFMRTDHFRGLCDHKDLGALLQRYLEQKDCTPVLCLPIRHLWDELEPLFLKRN